MPEIHFLNRTIADRAGASPNSSDHRRRRFRLAALPAALALLLAAPLAPPAWADEGRLDVGVILDSSELLGMINGGVAPATPVAFEVLAASGNGTSVLGLVLRNVRRDG